MHENNFVFEHSPRLLPVETAFSPERDWSESQT